MLHLDLTYSINIPFLKTEWRVNLNTWIDLFTKKFSDYSGYVLSLDDAVIVLKAYVVATTSTLLSKQKALEPLLCQEISKVYIKINFLMSILIQYKF